MREDRQPEQPTYPIDPKALENFILAEKQRILEKEDYEFVIWRLTNASAGAVYEMSQPLEIDNRMWLFTA